MDSRFLICLFVFTFFSSGVFADLSVSTEGMDKSVTESIEKAESLKSKRDEDARRSAAEFRENSRQSAPTQGTTTEHYWQCKLVCRTAGLSGDRADLGLVKIYGTYMDQTDKLKKICESARGGNWYVGHQSCDEAKG